MKAINRSLQLIVVIIWVFSRIPMLSAFSFHLSDELDFYSAGMQKVNEGKWEIGLRYWAQGLKVQEEFGKVDPRLSIGAIELVTKHKVRKMYKEATHWYLLMWRCYDPVNFSSVYEEELERLFLIMPESKADRIRTKYNTHDYSFTEEVLEFWLDSDPVVTTLENERLMEHWERVLYARQMYQKDARPPYNTDPRGEIYIRYGKPDKTKNLFTWVTGFRDPWTREYQPFNLGGITQINIEMWRYTVKNGKESLTWYFGENPDEGRKYGAYQNVIDLIPTKNVEITLNREDMFTDNDTTGMVLLGSHMLQSRRFIRDMVRLAGIEQLALMEPEIGPVYDDLVNYILAWGTNGLQNPINFSASMRSFNMTHSQRLYQKSLNLPKEDSKRFPLDERIPFNYKVYRFLDTDGSTTFALSFYNDLEEFVKKEQKFVDKFVLEAPQLYVKTSYLEYDSLYRMQYSEPRIHKIKENTYEDDLVLLMNSRTKGKRIYLSRDLVNINKSDFYPEFTDSEEERYRRTLVATTGNVSPVFPDVLVSKPMMMSDIILAQDTEINIDQRIPFAPSYTNKFKNTDDLLVYLEMYNLPSKDYTLNVSVVSKKILSRKIFADRAKITLKQSAQNQISEPQYLRVDLSEYTKGEYELKVDISSGGKSTKSSVKFLIIE